MLHRSATLLIIVFWLTMTGLLVRNELVPEGSGLREVPVSHVLKLLFLPEHGSDLNITSEGTLLGRLSVRPHVDDVADTRQLEFDSAMQLRTGPNSRQRIKLEGKMQLDRTMQVERFDIALSLFEPSPIRTEVAIEPAANRAHVTLSSQAGAGPQWVRYDEYDYTLDQAGARQLLAQTGLDPALLTGRTPQAAPKVRARLSSMLLHGERVETYLLTIEQSGQTLVEMHVSQLGNVLLAKTILGYTFAPDDVTP